MHWIHSDDLDIDNVKKELSQMDGVLVAPGFGSRGVSGKIDAVQFARENLIPFLGICLGMQCAVIEFARNVLNLEDANTTEIADKTKTPVIAIMEAQKNISDKGGTMRLGAYSCELKPNSNIGRAFHSDLISERHRHRYEFNNTYLNQFEEAGMVATGTNPKTGLVEVVEIPSHPWFVGVQFHPEYKSTVAEPHPLFVAFIKASLNNKKK